MKTIKIGILGGAGYTGGEVLRLLLRHPNAEIISITSREFAKQKVAQVFAFLDGQTDLSFVAPGDNNFNSCDVVFCATPNGVAMSVVPGLLKNNIKVIDLSADFRLRDKEIWQKWYAMQHTCPQLLETAVYGLPETNREQIRKADLVANPGCYPTAVQLGFLPLIENKLVDLENLIADVKSGVSGAGRAATTATAFGEMSDSFKAYAAAGHRHHPEIVQELKRAAGGGVDLVFIPHLLPIIRGIHATLYAKLLKTKLSVEELHNIYIQRYAAEPFVEVMPLGAHPDTRSVRGSNVCRLAVVKPSAARVVILAVEDNLVKGAAGQAIQNMNLMFGLAETAGLQNLAVVP